MAKIAAFSNWKLKFLGQILDYWKAQGHEVRYELGYNPALHEWSDVCFIDVGDHNAIVGSNNKFPNSKLAIRIIDIEAWVRQPRGITWENVDVCIFGAKHIEELVRSYLVFPSNVEVVHIPFGVDISKWTFRERDGKGKNVAFVAHQWSAKGLPLLLQVMAKIGPEYKLHVVGTRNNERWLHQYVDYMAGELGIEMTMVDHVADLDAWLDDKDFMIVSSQKETFSYVAAEAATKGIKPIIHNFWRATDIWPRGWVWSTIDEAAAMFSGPYDSHEYRDFMVKNYSLERMMRSINDVCGIGDANY